MLIQDRFGYMHLQWFAEDDGQNANGSDDSGADDEPAGQPDDYKAKYEDLAKEIELIKKAQSGVDRENKKLREQLQEKDQGKQSAEEQIKQMREEMKTRNAESARKDVAFEHKIDKDVIEAWQGFLKNDDPETLKDYAVIISEKNSEIIKAGIAEGVQAEIKRRFGDKEPPKGGESEKSSYTKKEIAEMKPEEFAKLNLDKIKIT